MGVMNVVGDMYAGASADVLCMIGEYIGRRDDDVAVFGLGQGYCGHRMGQVTWHW